LNRQDDLSVFYTAEMRQAQFCACQSGIELYPMAGMEDTDEEPQKRGRNRKLGKINLASKDKTTRNNF